MPRRVKCQATGEYGTSDFFIKIGGKYYKSQEIYDENERKKKERNKTFGYFKYNFLKLDKKQHLPTIVYKEVNNINSYGFDIINATIEENMDSIMYALSHKDFNSEVGKVRYVMAIIKNNINDIYKKEQRLNKSSLESRCKVEQGAITEEEIAIEDKPILVKPKRDIRAWLEDDED